MTGGSRRRRAQAWAWVYAAVFGPEDAPDVERDGGSEKRPTGESDGDPTSGDDGGRADER